MEAPGVNCYVTAAKLIIRHTITNNPNDQLRPEDIENEAASGRKPSYEIFNGDTWVSTIDCYEGDGDFIGIEEGSGNPTLIGAGTVLRNTPFGFADYSVEHDLYAFSADLVNGFTNAYYTSINPDPFEWSYDADTRTRGSRISSAAGWKTAARRANWFPVRAGACARTSSARTCPDWRSR